MADAATEARELIRIVRDDPGLPAQVRRSAGELAALGASNPDLALERMDELHRTVVAQLPMDPPTIDYARCVCVEVFWRFNLDPSIKEFFASPQDYRRFIETDPEPGQRLAEHLGPQLIVPEANSWLIPDSSLAGLSGPQAKALLNFTQPPPYVVMVFTVEQMSEAGVLVREPRGIDAIPSRQIQWFPDNVPDERIDRDVPRAALGRIEWRP